MNELNILANYCRRITPTRVRYIFKKSNIKSNTSLNSFSSILLHNISFNLFLSNLNIYKYFCLHIDVVINYQNNTYKRISLIKNISNNDSNKFINVNLTSYINPMDLRNFKIIFIDIYTQNILLYFSSKSFLKAPYLNLQFKTYKDFCNYNTESDFNYNKVPFKPYSSPPALVPNMKEVNTPPVKNNIFPPYKPINISKLISRYNKKKFSYLIKKFINKYITVKVEFNGIKILNGILDKITSDTITLIDNDCKHIICIDSISIISSDEYINTANLISKTQYSDISVVLNYLKDNNINLKINDKDLNISTVKIINSCDSFLEVEDIKTKKTYYLNLDYIKTIESIPQKD